MSDAGHVKIVVAILAHRFASGLIQLSRSESSIGFGMKSIRITNVFAATTGQLTIDQPVPEYEYRTYPGA